MEGRLRPNAPFARDPCLLKSPQPRWCLDVNSLPQPRQGEVQKGTKLERYLSLARVDQTSGKERRFILFQQRHEQTRLNEMVGEI